jgi:hypothetical protein
MAKAKAKKTKTPKKSAPASGMVVKSTVAPTYGKASSFIANKNFSSAKKGGITSTPRKAK